MLAGQNNFVSINNDAGSFFENYGANRENLPKLLHPRKIFLLLYLNVHTFQGNADGWEVARILHLAMDKNISIILAHERDPLKNGCSSFGDIIGMTPHHLMEPPYEMYSSNLVIPFHGSVDFRLISLRSLMIKIGAQDKKRDLR